RPSSVRAIAPSTPPLSRRPSRRRAPGSPALRGRAAASSKTGSTRRASVCAACNGGTAASPSPPTRTTSSPWWLAPTEVGQQLVTVDPFTDRPFAGNPAAVCVLDAYPADDWMQAVAREMNLSETAFVVRRVDGDWDLRWFSPTVEIDLCGHAPLSAAHVLWQDGLAPATDALRFRTR